MKASTALVALGLLAVCARGADQPLAWPQFRGPNGSGIADSQTPPVEFGPGKNVKWKVPAPSGLSSPIVAGDLLVITAFDQGKLCTVAYRRADGAEAWRAEAPVKQLEPYYKAEGSPASSTSATDGERIVSYFGSCGLVCYDLSGKELWKDEMPPAAVPGSFGSGVSPIIADGTVVLVRDEGNNSKILALDVKTGGPRWEQKRESVASYSTPVLWDTPDGKQIVAAGHGRLIGYDLKTGAEKWSFAGMPSGPCSSPVVADDVLYYAGYSPGSPEDKQGFHLPPFDTILQLGDTNKDGVLSREEAQKTWVKDMFDAVDANKDGKITRQEWDAVLRFMASGKNSAFALRAGGSGDVTSSHLLWKKTKGLPYISTALVYRGQCLLVKDGGLLTAYDARTGSELYVQERVLPPGSYYASPVAANGNVYVVSKEDGAVTVLKGGSAKPTVVVKNPKLGEGVAATPAIADNVIYIRTAKNLYAFGVGK